MKRMVLFLPALLLLAFVAKAQIVDITNVASTSSFAPLGATTGFHGSEFIYSDTEIGNSNFTTAATAINKIGFSIGTVGTGTTFNSVEVYMKDIPSTTTVFPTSSTIPSDPLSSYTQVFTGSMTFTATGFTEFALTTPFVRTAGSNLQVLVIRNDGVIHSGFIFTSAVGINGNSASTTYSSRRYNGSTAFVAGSSAMGVSSFRAAIRLKHEAANDASVANIYTLGKLPIPNAEMQAVQANITNIGINTLTNIPVTLDITGANSFTAVETITSLAPGASQVVTFPSTFFFNAGTNNVSVSIPADDNPTNDINTVSQLVNANTWSYAYGSTVAGGIGFTAPTYGDFVAKFNTNASTFITQVTINLTTSGRPFRIGLWDATGAGGTPGALVWESALLTTTPGVYVLPITPAVPLSAGDFFVGVRQPQLNSQNVGFAYQAESPVRTGTFYYTSNGTGTWTDFAVPGSPFRFMIEPKLILGTDASVTAVTTNGGTGASCLSGTQNVDVTINNPGANDIAPGSAAVYLNIGGANTYSGSAFNLTNIGSGGSETISFPNVPLTTPGTNNDTVFVVVSGDQDPDNDTMKIVHELIPAVSALPSIEGFETTPLIFGTTQQLAGTGQWVINTGIHGNLDLIDSLKPHSGNVFALFDSWNFGTGTSSRLSSGCFDIPPSGGGGLCNTTELGFWMSHDASYPTFPDSVYVSISTNGGTSWTRLLPGYARHDATALVPTWRQETIDLSAYAGQSVRIGFEAIGKFGNVIGLDNVMVASRAVQNVTLADNSVNNVNLVNACEDAGWTYYHDPLSPDEYVLAINWDPNGTGANISAKAAAIPTITVDATHFSSESPATQEAAYTMRRYWNVDIGSNSLTEPVNMRFFYDSTEIDALTTAVNNFITANGGIAKTGTWFKTNTGAFAPNTTLVTPQGVTNAVALVNANADNSRINGIAYAEFNGIASFSGGTFTAGVGLGGPLEPSFLDIVAQRSGTSNKVTWTLPGSYRASHFMVERSINGTEFYSIEKVTAINAQTTSDRSYSALDRSPSAGTNFYRVKLVENDGKFSYSKVVNVKNSKNNPISVFPNPAREQVAISINAEHETMATILVTDVTGKVMIDLQQALAAGANKITVALNDFSKGTYIIKMVTGNDTYIEQFNVQ